MKQHIFTTAGHSAALNIAVDKLKKDNTFLPSPQKECTVLLLPVPSLQPDGTIVGGGDLSAILEQLPKNITVIGGNLRHPKLTPYKTIDLLQDPIYLAKNAAITAYCAVADALTHLPVIIHKCPILILGWGRIGKCLAQLLCQMGAFVTVAARKETDRACATSLGYNAIKFSEIKPKDYRLIYNTIPYPVLYDSSAVPKIELASTPGMEGENIIDARGLPSKRAPESSGLLIAETITRLLKERDDSL